MLECVAKATASLRYRLNRFDHKVGEGVDKLDVVDVLVEAIPSASDELGTALWEGITDRWPEGESPSLSAAQLAELAAAALRSLN